MKLDISITRKILSNCGFFKGLSTDNLRVLAETCLCVQLRKKETLFLEGTKSRAMYLLFEGMIRLFKTTQDGSEIVIKVVNPGEIFAEVVLFEQADFPVTAEAMADSTLLEIPRAGIQNLLDNRRFRNDFIAMLMERQRYLAHRIQYLTHYDVEERFFLFLQSHYGQEKNINLNISKKDLASSIGATPETLSRLIKKLESEKRISWKGRTCKILQGGQRPPACAKASAGRQWKSVGQ